MGAIRILLWSPNGAGLHYGGAGTNAYRLYASAQREDIVVTLACACPVQEDYPVFSEIAQIYRRNSQNYIDHIVYMQKAKRWLRTNAHRFDVFHGIDIFDNTVRPAFWAEQSGLPAVIKPAIARSGLAPAVGFRKILQLPQKRRKLVSKLSGIVAISSEIERELIGYGVPSKVIHRIPNGVDAVRFHPSSPGEREALRLELGWADDEFVLLFVGALTPRKQPAWMLTALRPLLAAGQRVRAVFVGPGKADGHLIELEKQVAAAGWKDRVAFLGLRRDVERIYRAVDLFCLPSLNEGMPNSVLEAMASGLPSLVTKISGSEDLIEDGKSGYFIDSPEALRQRLIAYQGNPQMRLEHGNFARQQVEEKYSTKRVWAAHLELFNAARQRKGK